MRTMAAAKKTPAKKTPAKKTAKKTAKKAPAKPGANTPTLQDRLASALEELRAIHKEAATAGDGELAAKAKRAFTEILR